MLTSKQSNKFTIETPCINWFLMVLYIQINMLTNIPVDLLTCLQVNMSILRR